MFWKVIAAIFVSAIAVFVQKIYQENPIMTRVHVKRGNRKALVVGATGATGLQVVEEILKSDEWSKVVTIGRREAPLPEAEKLEQVVVSELNEKNLSENGKYFDGVDTVFNCIGTTRATSGSAEKFVAIEVGISEATAKVAKQHGVPHFSMLSAQGANPNAFAVDWIHPLLYVKTMGRKEQVAIDEKFPRTSIFQPGMLGRSDHITGREEPWIIRTLAPYLEKLPTNLAPIHVNTLAKAMVRDAESDVPDTSKVEQPMYFTGNTMITSLVEREQPFV